MIAANSSSAEKSRPIPALENLPARLNVEMTALVLGFQQHDVPVLVTSKLLVPLGDPAPNAAKFFAKASVAELASDVKWLHKATIAVGRYWKRKRCRSVGAGQERDDATPACETGD